MFNPALLLPMFGAPSLRSIAATATLVAIVPVVCAFRPVAIALFVVIRKRDASLGPRCEIS